MGRASRRKKVSIDQVARLAKPVRQILHAGDIPAKLYRFLPEEWQADRFAAGHVWISTLQACRRYEQSGRGDPGEATVSYYSGMVTGSGTDASMQLLTAKMRNMVGVDVVRIGPGCSNITINNVTVGSSVQDAYILCMTDAQEFDEESTFGRFCVEISDPIRVFDHITQVLHREMPMREAVLGPVTYAMRTFEGAEDQPGRIGFVKPSNFQSQREFRMFWRPNPPTTSVARREFFCPSIATQLKRVR